MRRARPVLAAAALAGAVLAHAQDGCADRRGADALVCGDSALALQAGNLDDVLAAVRSYAVDRTALDREQRDWQAARDRCDDAQCLEDAYATRWIELFDRWRRGAAVTPDPPGPAALPAICGRLAALADANALPGLAAPRVDEVAARRAHRADLLPGDTFVALPFGAKWVRLPTADALHGTARLEEVARVAVADPHDDVSWALRGRDEFVIVFEGRAWAVTGPSGVDSAIGMASLVESDGRLRPACLFASEPASRQVVPGAWQPAPCEAVAADRLRPLSPDRLSAHAADDGSEHARWRAALEPGGAEVDLKLFDPSGRDELDRLRADGAPDVDRELSRLDGVGTLQLLRLDGRLFIEASDRRFPGTDRVWAFDHGRLREACAMTRHTRSGLARTFAGPP